MARRLNLKQLSFKLTKRSASGKVTHHLVPRGFDSSQETEGTSIEPYQDASSSSNAAEDFTTDDALPSLHQIHHKQSVQAWRNMRQELLKISIETEAMPENEQCYVCLKEVATMRCLQCSSRLYHCSTCFNSLHSRTNIFHRAEVWEVILARFFSVVVTE